MDHCPGSTGCRCPLHYEGLAAHAQDRARYDQALERLQPTRLVVVTPGPRHNAPSCDSTMTCPCPTCTQDRVSRPAQGAGNASPFKVRTAA